MTVAAGTKLGPYEILSPLGAGGMGEVYRARDERLKRDVAIKVLPASVSSDPDRLRRFEHEAQAAGGLNHPNITAVHDIGSYQGAPYIVTELLDGEPLRSRLAAGALPNRKAIDYAIQIAQGLAAAHEKGIIHRDLKPENLFVTRDGRVKILDFGLAKLVHPEPALDKATEAPTVTAGTDAGIVMGTVGYMSPEQVRGQPADARSDIFAFGSVLYEMLSGKRAFERGSAADTMSAILNEDLPDLSNTNPNITPALERIARHCLEKNPEERFYSAHDLAFDLETISGLPVPATVAERVARSRPKWLRLGLITASGLVALVLTLLLGERIGSRSPANYRQLTFRNGFVASARFAPDGQTVLYTAAWEGKPPEVFLARPGSAESRPFGMVAAEVLAMSSSGEMAVSLRRRNVEIYIRTGTLARISVTGASAPREIQEDVQWADWSADGESLAIVRDSGVRNRLEFPIGKILYEATGWISHPRVSPNGDLVAFMDHPSRPDDAGAVAIVDRFGHKTTLSPLFTTAEGLAWSPGGREIWFTAAETGLNRALYAVTLGGRQRLIARVPGELTLEDISRDGQVLVTHALSRLGILGLIGGEQKERDLSWLDYSGVTDLSADGRTMAFFESGEGSGLATAVGPDQRPYLCPLDGGLPTPIPGLTPEDLPLRWSANGRSLYVCRTTEAPANVYRLDIASGQKELWRKVMPDDAAGVITIFPVLPTPDGESYVYSYFRTLSNLYEIEGLK